MAPVVGLGARVESTRAERMTDRNFTELDLRSMLQKATRYRRDIVRGRWVIQTRHRRRCWEVIVEPDLGENLLVVITAYPLEREAK